jgi:hypothetical protein
MAYAAIYFGQFQDLKGINYDVTISKKNYVGGLSRITLANDACIQSWVKDEPLKGIKGCQLIVNLVNDGSLPLTTFYSDEDNTFKVEFVAGGTVIFVGFLVQDDCQEDLIDYSHIVSLSFTDNLGLLKDVTVSDLYNTTNPSHNTIYNFIANCLGKTGCFLDIAIYFNLFETSFATNDSPLRQSVIDFNGFASSSNRDSFKSCYDVLNGILERFNACLFQAEGQWHIVRWHELRYTNKSIPYYLYDGNTYLPKSTGAWSNIFNIGFGTNLPFELGAYYKIERPQQYVLDTFMYQQPPNVWNNSDLKQLGTLRAVYTTGSGVNLQTIEEYNLVGFGNGFIWQDNAGTIILYNTATPKFIRVVKNYLGREIDRYMVVSGSGAPDDRTVISSDKILLNKGDAIKITFDARRNASAMGAATKPYFAWLVTKDPINPRGANNKALNTNGDWIAQPTPIGQNNSIVTTYTSSEDLAEWKTIEVQSKDVPFDGYLYIQFGTLNVSGNYNEWHYKNFKAEITYNVDKVGRVKGHTHKQSQISDSKKTEKKDLLVDDTTSNNIAGTLLKQYNPAFIIHQKTSIWKRFATSGEQRRLGDITTFEDLFYTRTARTYVEGNVYGLTNGARFISPLSVFQIIKFGPANFILGRCEINYRNSMAKISIFELYKDGENDASLSPTYKFDYIID